MTPGKGWLRSPIAPALLTACGLLASPAVHADDYADFRIPAHDQLHWGLTLGTAGNRNSNDASSLFQSTDRSAASLTGLLRTRFNWLSDSDPMQSSLDFAGDLQGGRFWDKQNSLRDLSPIEVLRFEDARSQRNLLERWQLGFTHRRYPWELPMGLEVSLSGVGDYQQRWDRQSAFVSSTLGGNNSTTTRGTDVTWSYRYGFGASLVVGLGRVRNATGVFEADVVEQRLLDAGAITRRLSSAARQRLARLIYLRGSVIAIRDRPTRSIWQALEAILQEDGVLSERGLDGYSVMKAGEPLAWGSIFQNLPTSPVTRLRGWFAGPLLSDEHFHNVRHGHTSRFRQDAINDTLQPPQEFDNGFRLTSSFDRVMGGARAEGHWPLGSRWQIDALTQTLIPLRAEENGFQLANQGAVSYLIADRWLASAGVGHSRRVRENTVNGNQFMEEDAWGVFGFARADYYLEDRLSFGVGFSASEDHFRGTFETNEFRSIGVNLGVNYRFIGRYHAPGLLGPIDVMHEP